ncbi:MAG: hypothetical protein H0T79_15350, partial [Deltaproteobacteria bacterium]|nr:hypothetical protein [Deltaproteobacteria bacterium]
MAMAACGGGKASTDDCAKAIENTNAVSRDEIKKMNLSDETTSKLTSITLKHCTADKWDTKVVKCLSAAKSNEETLKCTDGLAAEQKLTWQNDMAAALPKAPVPPEPTGSA